MARELNDVLNTLSPERCAKVEAHAAKLIAEELTLQELRKAKQHSQKTVAEILRVQQSEVSKIERRADMYVSTLRSFIEAMGGTLEITAQFPNAAPVKITQFSALD